MKGDSVPRPTQETIGARIKRFREDRDMTQSELSERAEISKSYLSTLENETRAQPRPSAQTLYQIAQALGVSIADLLGRPVVAQSKEALPTGLREFARRRNLPQADVDMLCSIQFRGERPKTPERWEFIYEAIKNSAVMDRLRR
jgi:transcriptional regulator with XRE-family HTH domain